MTALARRGYNQAAIEAEQARLDAVTQTNSAHETAKAAAVRTTTDRDAATKALDDWWAEFRAVAQVALRSPRLDSAGHITTSLPQMRPLREA